MINNEGKEKKKEKPCPEGPFVKACRRKLGDLHQILELGSLLSKLRGGARFR